MFEKCCRRLVESLPDSQVRDLMEFQRGWNDPETMAIVHRKLAGDVEEYIINVKRVKRKIRGLQKKLKLQENYEVCRFVVQLKAVGFTLNDCLRRDLLKSGRGCARASIRTNTVRLLQRYMNKLSGYATSRKTISTREQHNISDRCHQP